MDTIADWTHTTSHSSNFGIEGSGSLTPHGRRIFQEMAASSAKDSIRDTLDWVLKLVVGALLLSSSLNVACHQVRGLKNRQMRELPDTQELVGTWKIDENSLERLRGSHDALTKTSVDDHLLILRRDGTCFFKTYWAFQSDGSYTASEGHWRAALVETVAGSGEKRAAVAMTLAPTARGEVTTEFWVVREKGQLVLWKYIGDPDYAQYADFHRIQQ